MSRIIEKVTAIVSKQYRQPSGLLGFLVGYKMSWDHQPENGWTVSLLKA
jgi:hypothetical protein